MIDYTAKIHRGEVLAMVPWIAGLWGQKLRQKVEAGLAKTMEEHGEREEAWWKRHIEWSNTHWIAHALARVGEHKAAAPFRAKVKILNEADEEQRLERAIEENIRDGVGLWAALAALVMKRRVMKERLEDLRGSA